MHMCAQTHGRAYVQPPTLAHIYIYTPMYTHVRTYTRTRENFSDCKSAIQHCQTEFHHQSTTIHSYYPITVQSISILTPPSQQHLHKLSASVIVYHPFIIHYHLLQYIHHISATYILLILIHLLIILHHLARIIPSLSNFHYHQSN